MKNYIYYGLGAIATIWTYKKYQSNKAAKLAAATAKTAPKTMSSGGGGGGSIITPSSTVSTPTTDVTVIVQPKPAETPTIQPVIPNKPIAIQEVKIPIFTNPVPIKKIIPEPVVSEPISRVSTNPTEMPSVPTEPEKPSVNDPISRVSIPSAKIADEISIKSFAGLN